MRIGIRADGGPQTGMGHVMRCLSLARELGDAHHEVLFIGNDPTSQNKITESGFRALGVDINREVKALTEIIHQNKLDCLIIDSYQVDQDYFLGLKKVGLLLCYIDDLNKFSYPVDILINGNFAAETMEYRKYLPEEQLLLGTSYNLIRKEFQGLTPVPVKSHIERVLITMGGTDPVNFSSRLIREIRQDKSFDNIQLDVVVGDSNPFQSDLRQLSIKYPLINLHQNVPKMSELMRQADLSISAGGSTLYELCACGTPAFTVIIADNQEFLVTKLTESGYIKSLGWYNRVDFNILRDAIKRLDGKERQIISDQARKLVDGFGTLRVREAIEGYYRERYEI